MFVIVRGEDALHVGFTGLFSYTRCGIIRRLTVWPLSVIAIDAWWQLRLDKWVIAQRVQP